MVNLVSIDSSIASHVPDHIETCCPLATSCLLVRCQTVANLKRKISPLSLVSCKLYYNAVLIVSFYGALRLPVGNARLLRLPVGNARLLRLDTSARRLNYEDLVYTLGISVITGFCPSSLRDDFIVSDCVGRFCTGLENIDSQLVIKSF